MKVLTAPRLREVLFYNKKSGIWTHAIQRGPKNAGDIAGTIGNRGYRQISVDGKLYQSSRLAWLYMTGSWPSVDVDHRDLNKTNDRWSNLRLATRPQNKTNGRKYVNNSSGFKGVSIIRGARKNPFQAKISNRYLGVFSTAKEASDACLRAAEESFGKFARRT